MVCLGVDNFGNNVWRDHKKDDCIDALKAKLEEKEPGEIEYFSIPKGFWEEQICKGLVKLAKDNTKPMSMQIEAILNLLQTKLTKSDRFARLRLFAKQYQPVFSDVIPELNDLLEAHDEANELIVNVLGLNADITKLHDWLKKWA
jgi:hypothetical protein